MQIKYHFFEKSYVFLAFAGLICSCVEDKYDLSKDIELKVSFSDEGLTLPESNSSALQLEQIMDLSEGGQLTTDSDGNYLFYKKCSDMSSTTITVGQGSLCDATEATCIYRFKQDEALETEVKSGKYNTATMRFSTGVWPQYSPDRMEASIRELTYITTPLTIDIVIMFENVSDFAPSISEIRYRVPSFYDIEDESDLVETNVSVSGLHRHSIRTRGVNFGAALRDGDVLSYNQSTGEITMKGEIRLDCTINTAHMDEYEASEDPQMTMRITTGTLGTNEVTGRFYKQESIEIEPITFDDLPDVVTDEEVVIDIENPVVRLTVDNEVPSGAFVNATLTGIRGGTRISGLNIGSDYGTDTIYFGPQAVETIWISRRKTEVPDSVRENVVIDNIMTLLEKMPDEIRIDAVACTDSSAAVTLGLNKDYMVRPAYELAVPLKIGKDMKLVYKKEADGLHRQLKNISVERLVLTATAINSIPLDLNMAITAKDRLGNVIDGIELEQDRQIEAMGETEVELHITGSRDDFARLDKIELTAYATANEQMSGQRLNESQALILENVRITVK